MSDVDSIERPAGSVGPGNPDGKLKCQGCGKTKGARRCKDLFMEDVHNRVVMVVLCPGCYRERVWEI